MSERRAILTLALACATPPCSMRLALALLTLIAAASPASAGLSVCNKTAHALVVALGRFTGKDWTSQGWWHVPTQSCSELISGPLDARYYYLYATDGAFGSWDGEKNFCVGVTEQFLIEGRDRCVARGSDSRGFFEIDTGKQLSWTQSISN